MPTYLLIEHGDNYSKASGSLWQYHRDGTTFNDDIPIVPATLTSESFKLKKKLRENVALLLQKMVNQRLN